ncbi:MAG: outer membrane protein assembly factor BamC [Gallionella sp.]|nr:outer membrane protein assembly factor BamC [Gallionella sp.]
MRVLQVGMAGVLLVSLAGCGLFAEKHVDYQAGATQSESLEVPPDLSKPVDGELYKVPQGGTGNPQAGKAGVPNSAEVEKPVLPVVPGVRLERAGTQRWLVVQDNPENVWRVVKAFWTENGFALDSEDQSAGIMETGWREDLAKGTQGSGAGVGFSTGERDQYRSRLERGKDPGTVEIYLTHRGLVATLDADKATQWLPSANDPELEAQMLQRLMARLGGNPSAEGAAKADGEAVLQVADNGPSSILIKDAFDKSWRRVGLAIDRLKLVLEDKDRSKGIYYLQPIKAGGKFKLPKEAGAAMVNYRVLVQDGGATCTVVVTATDGSSNASGKQLLEALYKNIQP